MSTPSSNELPSQPARIEELELRLIATQRRLTATWGVCLTGLLAVLVAGHQPEAMAQQGGLPKYKTLVALSDAVVKLETDMTNVKGAVATLQTQTAANTNDIADLKGRMTTVEGKTQDNTNDIADLKGRVTALENSNAALLPRVAALENKTQYIAVGANQTFIVGDLLVDNGNVRITNGTGSTNAINTRGNLILGYNDANADDSNNRIGSHNLIIGDFHQYTSHSGIISGRDNKVLAPFASVTSGSENVASNNGASVTGGSRNTASGDHASVSGGAENHASGVNASVTGGIFNSATSDRATVTGGVSNKATGPQSCVSGGNANVAHGGNSWVGGGQENLANFYCNTIVGGVKNFTDTNFFASICGGQNNVATGFVSVIGGGVGNTEPRAGGWWVSSLLHN